jgi:hypothetical protein
VCFLAHTKHQNISTVMTTCSFKSSTDMTFVEYIILYVPVDKEVLGS